MADQLYKPLPSVPTRAFPKDADSVAASLQKAMLADNGGFGGIILANTEKYRDPTAYPLPPTRANATVPTLALYCKVDCVLTACVFETGREWRGPTGTILTTLNLAGGMVHQVALRSFTLTTGTDLHVYLAEPWVALIPA